MAYMSKDAAAVIRANLAEAFPKNDGWKLSTRITSGHLGIAATFLQSPVKLEAWNWDHCARLHDMPNTAQEAAARNMRRPMAAESVNRFWYQEHHPKESADIFAKALKVIMRDHWDESDSQRDYFHCAFYIELDVGSYGKPCVYTGKP